MERTFILRGEPNARTLWAFLKANWRTMAATGRPLAVTVREAKAKRSVEQNARLWAMLNEIAASAWVGGRQFPAEAWHEHFKRRLIGLQELPDGLTVGISTTTLSVAQMTEYMDAIEAIAVDELGVEIGAAA